MIRNLNFLEKSLFFARISLFAYKKPDEALTYYKDLGFNSTYFDNGGAEAYLLENDSEIILAFRGTEPNEYQDIIHDIKINMVKSSSGIGKVHSRI
jgi:triacylglycerol lipase